MVSLCIAVPPVFLTGPQLLDIGLFSEFANINKTLKNILVLFFYSLLKVNCQKWKGIGISHNWYMWTALQKVHISVGFCCAEQPCTSPSVWLPRSVSADTPRGSWWESASRLWVVCACSVTKGLLVRKQRVPRWRRDVSRGRSLMGRVPAPGKNCIKQTDLQTSARRGLVHTTTSGHVSPQQSLILTPETIKVTAFKLHFDYLINMLIISTNSY